MFLNTIVIWIIDDDLRVNATRIFKLFIALKMCVWAEFSSWLARYWPFLMEMDFKKIKNVKEMVKTEHSISPSESCVGFWAEAIWAGAACWDCNDPASWGHLWPEQAAAASLVGLCHHSLFLSEKKKRFQGVCPNSAAAASVQVCLYLSQSSCTESSVKTPASASD